MGKEQRSHLTPIQATSGIYDFSYGAVIKPKALYMLGKSFVSELHPSNLFSLLYTSLNLHSDTDSSTLKPDSQEQKRDQHIQRQGHT